MPTGLGDEQLWISATNDNTGTSTAFNDLSGEGNDGTANGGMLVVASTGEGGTYAYQSNVANDYIEVPSFGNSLDDVNSLTWWSKYNSPTGNSSQIGSGTNGYVGTGNNRYYYENWGGVNDRCYNGAGSSGFINASNYAGNWTHHTFIRDTGSGTSELYINGVLVGTSTGGNYGVGVISTYFGLLDGAGTTDLQMDDIRSYGRVLTQTEITHLASARGVEGTPPVGLGDEQLWLCPSLNDSANDISGNGNDGTYQGGMGTVADTSNGGSLAYDFDGTNDYIDTGSTTVHQNTVFTYAFWLNASASASGTEGTAGSYSTGNTRGPLACSTSGNNKTTWLYQSLGTSYNSAQRVDSVGDAYDSTWHHIVCEFDGDNNETKIYIDGTLDISKTASVPNIVNINTALQFGAGSGGFTNGLMDDIRVYNRVLAQAEITHLASARGVEGTPYEGLGDEQLWISASNNNTGTSSAFNDLSGQGNNGTEVGTMPIVSDTGEGGTYAFHVDNSFPYIDCGNILDTPAEFTLSAWANRFSSDVGGIMGKWASSQGYMIYASTLTCAVNGGPHTAGNTLPLLTWQHVCATYDGTTVRVYQDGVLIASQADAAPLSTTANFLIGKYQTNSFRAYLDDLRVYDRAITPTEVSWLASSRGIEGPAELSTRYYDFGTATSPVKAGYQRVEGTAYDADLFGCGAGETSGIAVQSFDRNWGSDDMERDWCYSGSNRTFRDPTVVSGDYTIKAYCGDLGHTRDLYIDVWDGTSWVATTIQIDSVPSGTIQTATADITVGENGVAGLYIRTRKVSNGNWVICGLDLTPAGGPPPTTGFYNPFINKIFFNDYTRRIR